MKITTENNVKQFILDRVISVYIGFDDNAEVKLDQIIDYDIDLDRTECSTIELTNAVQDIELENHFRSNKSNHIKYVHIEALGVDCLTGEKYTKVYCDIPCDMIIRRLRIKGDYNKCPNMFIELEGFVR